MKFNSMNKGNNPIGIRDSIAECQLSSKWLFYRDECYTYAIYPRSLCQSTKADEFCNNKNTDRTCQPFQEGDEVKLIVKCIDWTLTYFINNQQVGAIQKIAKDVTYHLIMCIQHWNTQYKIVEFDHKY